MDGWIISMIFENDKTILRLYRNKYFRANLRIISTNARYDDITNDDSFTFFSRFEIFRGRGTTLRLRTILVDELKSDEMIKIRVSVYFEINN